MNKELPKKLYQKVTLIYESITTVVFSIILLFTILTILVGTTRLFFRLGDLFTMQGITGGYLYIFTDVLTLFILIELSRSMYEYLTIRRLRISLVLDAGIVFIVRDIMIALFKHELSTQNTYALSVLLLVLGSLRIGMSVLEAKESKEQVRNQSNHK